MILLFPDPFLEPELEDGVCDFYRVGCCYGDEVLFRERLFEARYVGRGSQPVGVQNGTLREAGVNAVGEDVQEVHLIGREGFRLLDEHRLSSFCPQI